MEDPQATNYAPNMGQQPADGVPQAEPEATVEQEDPQATTEPQPGEPTASQGAGRAGTGPGAGVPFWKAERRGPGRVLLRWGKGGGVTGEITGGSHWGKHGNSHMKRYRRGQGDPCGIPLQLLLGLHEALGSGRPGP